MFLQEAGNPENETILFLHGGDVAGWMWTPQVEVFQGQYHCLVPDLPGFGQSNQVPWQSFTDTAQQVAEMIRERGGNGRCHVVGLSMGGHLALHVLKAAPDLVDKVVLSCTAVRPYPSNLQRMVRVVLPLMRFKWFWQAQARMRGYPADAAPIYVETGLGINQESLRRMMAEMVQSGIPDGLHSFTHPVLIAGAELDRALIHDSQKDLLNSFPNAQAVIAPKVHHGWSGENSALFNRMMAAWLTDQPLPEALKRVNSAVPTLSV